MFEMMEEVNAQMATAPQWVQYWMNWMMGIFMASVLFVWKHKVARYSLAAFLITIPVGMVIFHFTHNVHLLGIAHLIVWGPLLVYLFKSSIKGQNLKNPLGVWVFLLASTITISLLFDVRDLVLIALGKK